MLIRRVGAGDGVLGPAEILDAEMRSGWGTFLVGADMLWSACAEIWGRDRS